MVTGLAEQRPVCVVSGRNRRVVQELKGANNLVVGATASIDGVAVEPNRASVASHHRLVAEPRCAEVERVVELLSAVPIRLEDDVTNEHAFETLVGRGIGAIVARPGDREVAGRATAAAFALESVEQVERVLDGLAK